MPGKYVYTINMYIYTLHSSKIFLPTYNIVCTMEEEVHVDSKHTTFSVPFHNVYAHTKQYQVNFQYQCMLPCRESVYDASSMSCIVGMALTCPLSLNNKHKCKRCRDESAKTQANKVQLISADNKAGMMACNNNRMRSP